MKTLIKIIALTITGYVSYGQQEYSYSNYYEVTPFFNPAATGSSGNQNIVGIFRKQWVGFNGTPVNGGIVYDNLLSDYNMGVGGYIFTDKIGETSMTNVAANYSYLLKFDNVHKVGFGVDAGIDVFSTDYNSLIYWDQEDRMFNDAQATVVVPRAGAGIYFFTDTYYAGFSVPRLLTFNNDSPLGINADRLPSIVSTYFLTGGYSFEINNDLEMQVNFLGKLTPHVIPQGDINVMGTYKELVGLGFGYRSLGFATATLQYTYDKVVTIGYTFDMSLTKIANYSKGSHEIMVKYTLPQKGSINMFK